MDDSSEASVGTSPCPYPPRRRDRIRITFPWQLALIHTVSILFGHWHSDTLLVGKNSAGMMVPLLLDGSLDGNVFQHWTKTMLIEELSPGQAVICDNVAVHKVAGVREALAEVDGELLFLPPCSPELHPIEKAFSRIKSCLRKVAARTREDLEDATGKALDLVTPSIACNYIKGCGYGR